jgi:hypothetical protein
MWSAVSGLRQYNLPMAVDVSKNAAQSDHELQTAAGRQHQPVLHDRRYRPCRNDHLPAGSISGMVSEGLPVALFQASRAE